MERPPRRRDEKLFRLTFILRSYFVQGTLLAFSCFATYYYMGWVLGAWRPGESFAAHAAKSTKDLKFDDASLVLFANANRLLFPDSHDAIANVICKRSWKNSLFSKNFLHRASPPRSARRYRQLAPAALRRANKHRISCQRRN